MKKDELFENEANFKADSQTIKQKDIEKLQTTFKQFFGSDIEEIRKRSSILKRRMYLFGLSVVFATLVAYYLIQKIKFVQF